MVADRYPLPSLEVGNKTFREKGVFSKRVKNYNPKKTGLGI